MLLFAITAVYFVLQRWRHQWRGVCLRLVYSMILYTNKIDRLQYFNRDRLTAIESIFTIDSQQNKMTLIFFSNSIFFLSKREIIYLIKPDNNHLRCPQKNPSIFCFTTFKTIYLFEEKRSFSHWNRVLQPFLWHPYRTICRSGVDNFFYPRTV